MLLLLFKTIHFVGFTAWLAGIFYLVRMFVYHTEAYDEAEPAGSILQERYALMEHRVYHIICNPAMIITWLAGIGIIATYGWEWFGFNTWLHIKIVLLMLLTIYQLYCKKLMNDLLKGKTGYSSFQFRLFNEVPTLLLIAIIIFAVYKNIANGFYALTVVVGLGIIFYFAAKAYRNARIKNKS